MIQLSFTQQAEPKLTEVATLHPVNVCGGVIVVRLLLDMAQWM